MLYSAIGEEVILASEEFNHTHCSWGFVSGLCILQQKFYLI